MRALIGATAATAAVAAAALAGGLFLVTPGQAPPPPSPTEARVAPPATRVTAEERPFQLAIIGDAPYGSAERRRFGAFLEGIDGRRRIDALLHLGDTKSGADPCTDAYYRWVRHRFAAFDGPVLYTPGDNEWSDCPGADPRARLATLRRIYFATPRTTLGGRPAPVRSQSGRGVPENVRFSRARACFGTVHVVGGNDAAHVPGQAGRRAAAVAHVDAVFDMAQRRPCRIVVLTMQADMFNPFDQARRWSSYSAYQPVVRRLAVRALRYRKPVLLFNGDSHVFRQDRPLAAGSPWTSFYGARAANNVLRTTVAGDDGGTREFLRVAVRPGHRPYLTVNRVSVG